jgi:hypothetical protein
MAATSVTRPTGRWLAFDVLAGIVLPVVCFAMEPIVSAALGRSWGGPSLLGPYRTFVYMGYALSTAALVAWLVRGPRLGRWIGPVAGMLLGGSLAALLIGTLLLPASLIGLSFALIGSLGLVPFATAMAYLHNSLDATHEAGQVSGRWRARGSVAAGLLLVIGVPTLAHIAAQGTIDAAVRAVSAGQVQALDNHRRWMPWCGLQCADAVREAYLREANPSRAAHLEAAYRTLTGREIARSWID